MRSSIQDFSLANPIYAGATVTFYTVSDGAKTSTKATLYAATTGSATLSNPQRMDSEGKFQQSVYVGVPVVATVSGLSIPDHDTGIIYSMPTFRVEQSTAKLQYSQDGEATWNDSGDYIFRYRGEWVTDTPYARNDISSNAGYLYLCVVAHTGGTFATDLAAGKWRIIFDAYSDSSGSSLVGFIQSGAGSVARTVQAKLRESVSAEDLGAVGNGTEPDTAAVANMLSDTRLVVSPSNSEYLIGPVNLAADKSIIGVSFLGAVTNAETLRTSTGAANVKLIGVNLDAAAGIGLHMNTNNCADVLVVGSNIKSMGAYGVLANTSSTGTDGVVLIGSSIYSDTGDAVELNTNLTDSYNYSTIGCLLTGGPNGSGTTAGFGIGIAGTDGHITVGNHIRSALNEAIHIEDSQRRGIVGFNTARACAVEGMRILFKAAAEGVVVVGNSLTHTGLKTNIDGYRIVNDANGHLTYNYFGGNVAQNFGSGYVQEGAGIQAAGDNIAVSCNLAIEIQSAGIWLGTTYAKSCTALATGGTRSIIGKLVSDTNVLVPISRTGTAAAGTILKGLNMPFAVAHTGASAVMQFNIVTLPNHMAGRATVIAGSGTQSLFYSAEVHWDGTTLTLSNILTQNSGNPTTVSLINNAGALALQFTSSTAQTWTAMFDFDGIWYKHT